MITPQKSNKTTIIIWGVATLVIVLIIIIVNIVMFATNKGLYGPYKPPPHPDKSVSPNGDPNSPDSATAILAFNPSILQTISNNANTYIATNPGSNAAEWGYYLNNA
jgi:hypothetical protein